MIRPVAPSDTAGLKGIIQSVGLFPPEMLDDMLTGYFEGRSDQHWIVDDPGVPVGLAYFAPERMTDRTWNLYLIAVHADWQKQRRGAAMLRSIEQTLVDLGGRLLLVKTSGLPCFEGPRAFYRRCGYDEDARIRDFYRDGDDEIVFRKSLR